MRPDEETLFAEAVLGRDAEIFMASDLGRYLVGRAGQEERIASTALATVSPWRRNRIRDLQAQIWRAQSVQMWLADIVQAGQAAKHLLEDEET